MSADEIVQKRLSDLEFRRWRILMSQIDSLMRQRDKLNEELSAVNKKMIPLYLEMKQLWEHHGKENDPPRA